jgi:AcrR family transcriptional regulator
MYFDVDNERVVRAFVECIAEHGAIEMSVDHVARRLGASRAGLYRQFGSWPQMVMFGYEAMLEWVDGQFPDRESDRRIDLESWWARMSALFSAPLGRGILAMRTLAALHCGTHALEEFELVRLRSFRRWCRSSPATIHACWALIRIAGNPKLTEEARTQLREIAWVMLGGGADTTDPIEATALAGLM